MPQKNKYLCLLCGGTSEVGPEFCSVNLHQFEPLTLNSKKNGFKGFFGQGGVHARCIEPFLQKSVGREGICVVCDKPITKSIFKGASKLAIYIYRKKDCAGVISIHDRCFKKIKCQDFLFFKFPKVIGG